jgi:hypothetical protein
MKKQFIKPSVGRVVLYWPSANDRELGMEVMNSTQPFSASVAFVHSDRMVNLQVADHRGLTWFREGVQLVQGDGEDFALINGQAHAEWMPYQQAQAAKHAEPPKIGEDGPLLAEPKTLAPYQQRVVKEKAELDGKLEALCAFIKGERFMSLDVAERQRLLTQSRAMADYSVILGERIAAF